MATLEFTNDQVQKQPGELPITDTSAIASNNNSAAPFDPENPTEAPIVIEPLADDASTLQKATYYYQCTRAYVANKTKNLRPWREFADRDEFAVPSKLTALANVSHNLSYWSGNYATIALVLVIYTALTNIVLTIGMTCCFAAYQYIKSRAAAGEPVTIGPAGRTQLSPTAAYALLTVISLLTFYMCDGGSSIFYLVSITGLIVISHAACRKPIESGPNVNPGFSFA